MSQEGKMTGAETHDAPPPQDAPSPGDALAIALAGPSDVDAVAILLMALDRHYLGPASTTDQASARAMVARTLAEHEGTRFALARKAGTPVALACFARVRPGARLTGVLWLKELFVVEEARGRGLGRAMLAFLAIYARREGLGRIDLTTGRDNASAQRFYEKLGGALQPKVFYRFDGDALDALAAVASAPGTKTDAEPG